MSTFTEDQVHALLLGISDIPGVPRGTEALKFVDSLRQDGKILETHFNNALFGRLGRQDYSAVMERWRKCWSCFDRKIWQLTGVCVLFLQE